MTSKKVAVSIASVAVFPAAGYVPASRHWPAERSWSLHNFALRDQHHSVWVGCLASPSTAVPFAGGAPAGTRERRQRSRARRCRGRKSDRVLT